MKDWLIEFWKKPESTEIKKETIVIDMMQDDVDPTEVTVENAYKTRWIWYHTILAIGIFMTNVLLIAILLLLAIKL
tara:strand:+ start:9018 stop:9245 length:228 start_codon:yes stop_codon:yes gene_type:complete